MKSPNILIVEDEPAILRALKRVFAHEGFNVSTAVNGEKGLAVGMRLHPDIIILDIVMPVMDGMTMLKLARDNGGRWGKNVKALVYSNLSYNEKREEAERLGVIEFLVKANVSLEDLVAKAKACLAA